MAILTGVVARRGLRPILVRNWHILVKYPMHLLDEIF